MRRIPDSRPMALRHLAAAAALAAAAFAGPASGQGVAGGIVWQSRNDNYNQLAQEFGGLYHDLIVLQRAGRTVRTTSIEVPGRLSIAQALRDRQLYDGPSLPIQLDVLACGFNPKVCSVQLGKSGDPAADDARTQWKIQAGETIVVPDIAFQPFMAHKEYQKRAGDSLKKIVVDDRRGCERYDAACERYVQNLNQRLETPLHGRYAGLIQVPTKAWRGVINFLPDAAPAAASGPPSTSLTERERLIGLAPELAFRAIPPARARANTAAATAVAMGEGNRRLLLRLISHPLATSSTLALPPGAYGSEIAVFDSWVDTHHCMLSKVTEPDPDAVTGATDRAPKCGENAMALSAKDHGTHVVGLINAKADSSMGPGVNPLAAIRTVSINRDRFVDPLYLAKQADRLRKLYKTVAPDVVNLSFEYSMLPGLGGNDVFLQAIADQESDTLFVVSAGNDGQRLSSEGECRVRPACAGGSNIIAVAALDLDAKSPDLFKVSGGSSNYGDRVHLGAPGLHIVSTIAGDRIGELTGTSQAAPVVAGAASLLYMHQHRLRPWEVKNRLIYTADLFPSLYDKVQGGRLNVKRLLAFRLGVVDTAKGQHLEGRLRDLKAPLVVDDDAGTQQTVPFEQVRRFAFDPVRKKYTLFQEVDTGRGPPTLVRRFVTLANPSGLVSFSVPMPSGPDRVDTVKLGELRDYVSAMKP